jgi:N-acetylmuramoyl-L-alanine amidase
VHKLIKRALLFLIPLILVFLFAVFVNYLIDNKEHIFFTKPVSIEKKTRSPKKIVEQKKEFKKENKKTVSPEVVISTGMPTVVIDPAHGGEDVGAVGYNGVLESQINLQFAFMLARELRMRGIRVYLTRTDDKSMSLEKRIAYANDIKPLLHVSINTAYNGIQGISGMEVLAFSSEQSGDEFENMINSFYQNYEGKYLPKTEDSMLIEQRIARQIKKELDLPYKASLERKFLKPLAISPNIPGLAVFVGYISNPDDVKRLSNNKLVEKNASLMATAIEKGMSLSMQE